MMDPVSDGLAGGACSDNPHRCPLRVIAGIGLAAIGVVLATMLYRHGGPPGLSGEWQLVLIGLGALIAGLGTMLTANPKLAELLKKIRLSLRGRCRMAAGVWAVAVVYLTFTAFHQHRDLFPRIHDELSYTIQARMLSQGNLWMPQHELADFFETFHLLTRPVYGSIYFPGTALLNVPGMWLRQPSWVMPVVIAAMAVAFSFLVASELTGTIAGLAAALLVLSTCLFRTYSTMVMAQVPAMLLGLLVIWCWLRWRQDRRIGWAIAIGVFAGWGAITRPVDALAFAIPVGLAMLLAIPQIGRRVVVRAMVGIVIGAAPFLALQAVFDWGVTGKPWKTPYTMYLEENQPGSEFGSAAPRLTSSETQLPQKQVYFARLTLMETENRQAGLASWAGRRLQMAGSATIPCAAILALVPLGLLFQDRRRWVVLAVIPLFLLLYAANPFFLLHYSIPLIVVTAVAAVLGIRGVEQMLPNPSARRFAGCFLTWAVVLLAVGSLPELNHHVNDEQYHKPLMDITRDFGGRVPERSVVLFRYTPGCDVSQEPVYNTDVGWPDDAPIIRAQDLGPRDGELLSYYAARQPDRSYFLFDRATRRMFPLGNAVQAAQLLHVPLNLPDQATPSAR